MRAPHPEGNGVSSSCTSGRRLSRDLFAVSSSSFWVRRARAEFRAEVKAMRRAALKDRFRAIAAGDVALEGPCDALGLGMLVFDHEFSL